MLQEISKFEDENSFVKISKKWNILDYLAIINSSASEFVPLGDFNIHKININDSIYSEFLSLFRFITSSLTYLSP